MGNLQHCYRPLCPKVALAQHVKLRLDGLPILRYWRHKQGQRIIDNGRGDSLREERWIAALDVPSIKQ